MRGGWDLLRCRRSRRRIYQIDDGGLISQRLDEFAHGLAGFLLDQQIPNVVRDLVECQESGRTLFFDLDDVDAEVGAYDRRDPARLEGKSRGGELGCGLGAGEEAEITTVGRGRTFRQLARELGEVLTRQGALARGCGLGAGFGDGLGVGLERDVEDDMAGVDLFLGFEELRVFIVIGFDLLVGDLDDTLALSARNIPNAIVMPAREANTYTVVAADWLVVTKSGLGALEEVFA